MEIKLEPWVHDCALPGVEKVTYRSDMDGLEDWALMLKPTNGRDWVVGLHGHGSTGDQIYTRADLRALWLTKYRRLGLGVLSPNLRGNSWMCPEAVADLHALLAWVRTTGEVRNFFFLSGSMGGTGNLIYATIHPEDVALCGALCPVTDIVAFYHWCRPRPDPLMDEVCRALESAYGGSPAQAPEKYAKHVVVKHAGRLTMPVLVAHALGDGVIPVEQPRALRRAMDGAANLKYLEIEGGNHDTPLSKGGMIPWLEEQVQLL